MYNRLHGCYKKDDTVNVRNPNVRISDDAEIRTKACSVCPCSDFGRSGPGSACSVQNPTKLDRFIYKGGHKQDFLLYKTV